MAERRRWFSTITARGKGVASGGGIVAGRRSSGASKRRISPASSENRYRAGASPRRSSRSVCGPGSIVGRPSGDSPTCAPSNVTHALAPGGMISRQANGASNGVTCWHAVGVSSARARPGARQASTKRRRIAWRTRDPRQCGGGRARRANNITVTAHADRHSRRLSTRPTPPSTSPTCGAWRHMARSSCTPPAPRIELSSSAGSRRRRH